MCSPGHVCNILSQICSRCGMGEAEMIQYPSITCEQYLAGKQPVVITLTMAPSHAMGIAAAHWPDWAKK